MRVVSKRVKKSEVSCQSEKAKEEEKGEILTDPKPGSQNKNKEECQTIQCFIFNNFGTEIIVETYGNKVTCISCLESYARIDVHLKQNKTCTKNVDLISFTDAYKAYLKDELKTKNRLRQAKSRNKKKATDSILYREKQKLHNKK